MLKFFRRIRRKLLDECHPGKYLLYAIGEILLVMVGILLALQVNNWNENRKSLQLAESYKERLVNDLEGDTINVNQLFITAHSALAEIQQYFDFFQTGEYTLEQVIDSSLSAISLTPYSRYLPINHTFQEMQSSGNLNLLPEEARELLMELNNQQEYTQIIQDRLITDAKHETYERDKYWDVSQNNFFATLNIRQDKGKIEQGLLHQNNFLRHIQYYYNHFLYRGEKLKSSSQEIIGLLRD